MAVSSLSSLSNISINNRNMNFGERQYKQNNLINTKYSEIEEEKAQKINNIKRMIRGADKNQNKTGSIVDQTLNYGESVRASRNNSKNTSDQLKKLKYNFKDISSQIRKSKTSVNAKQVASKARREIVRLKMKIQSGKYDTEELEAAITHAKAMERAAKKKARHLEEEELIKVTDKQENGKITAVSELESKLEEKMDAEYEASLEAKELEKEAELEKMSEEQIIEMEKAISESIDEVQEMMESSMEELSEDMYDLLAESMEDLMEQTLGELAESMMVLTDYEMNENEYTLFKLKHRASEDKSMLEADSKYLKTMFEIYERSMGIGGNISSGGTGIINSSVPISIDSSANIPNIVDLSV